MTQSMPSMIWRWLVAARSAPSALSTGARWTTAAESVGEVLFAAVLGELPAILAFRRAQQSDEIM
jgi:hypothetical protein